MALSDTAKTASVLHKWHHDDYEVAKRQILQAIGDVSDLEVWGSDVVVAMYVRPQINPVTGFIMGPKKQAEDVYNGKVVMIIKLGPDAFKGDEGWMKAKFGEKAVAAPGDWCFMRQGAGEDYWLCGDGGRRVLTKDRFGEDMEVYEWDGWPCRVVTHEELRGRILAPHHVV